METYKTAVISLVFVALMLGTGCVVQPRSCSLDPASPDPAIAQCAAAENATCVVETHPECRGEICIRMRGERGFCSVPCKHDAQCGEDERCAEVVFASGEYHCVPADALE